MLLELIADVDLLIIPNEAEVREMIAETGSTDYRDWFSERWNWYTILHECLEPYLCNGWEILDPCITGDLTEGLIITDGESVWHDFDYAFMDLLDICLNQHRGYVLGYVREMTDEQSKYFEG